MIDWFTRKSSLNLTADIHSHLIPGLDDGVESVKEALDILKFFESSGYEKVITTPHIKPELFDNSEEAILQGLELMQQEISKNNLKIKLEAAAEYYISPELLEAIDSQKKLLTFGKGYILIETSFYTKPLIFDEVVFKLKSNGYKPVLAHPERYQYLANDLVWLEEIRKKNVKLQVTLASLAGMYGNAPKYFANKLLKKEMVDFLGSDIHRENQVKFLARALRKKIPPQHLLNPELV